MSQNNNKFDTLIIGGGIAGQEAALNLANMDYKVLLVDKDLSIGGKMIQLSKVFPTLDCSACITTPKMSETARHPNITLSLNSHIKEIYKNDSGFSVNFEKKPRYVIPESCTGCQECEFACPEVRKDQYNHDMVGRKVAYIPFTLANPRIANIDRQDTSAPCIAKCPGGVKPYGYVSLVRNGQYDEAMKLHLEDAPIPGSLSRACYAPCQEECTRGELEGAVDMRRIKRFFTDYYYNKIPKPEDFTIEIKTGKRIAVIGSGPAGLTAAYQLAKKGHYVKIFESASELGGMLKLTIPEYRLPNELVDRDIMNVTSLGVEYEVNYKVENIKKLKDSGNFDSVFVAVGTHETGKLKAPGSELKGIVGCLDFLREANIGQKEDLKGKKVIIVGGGNTAIDAARTSIRLGAEKVTIVYRRSREQMPSFEWEVKEAEEEGVEIAFLRNPVKFIGENGNVKKAELIKMKLGEPDSSGRKRPIPVEKSEYLVDVDFVVEAIGLYPTTSIFSKELDINKDGTVKVNEKTLQTSTPEIFAGGDSTTGASTIIEAVGQGNKASFYIDKYLNKEVPDNFEFGAKLPAVNKTDVINRKEYKAVNPIKDKFRPQNERKTDFNEVEITFTEEEAKLSASRCMDCSNCRECHQCIEACPANAIDFSQKTENHEANAKSVIVSTGFNLFNPECKPGYGFNEFPNIIHALQMDRLIAPTRPFNNVVRPSDGKIPDNIAYVLCTGSRDTSYTNYNPPCKESCEYNPLCSQICCMYSVKQAQLLLGALPMADVTIYYMDIRAFGKGYEEFFQQGVSMGIEFVKGKIAKITEKSDGSGNLLLSHEDVHTGKKMESEHDLVVLSVGIIPNSEAVDLFKNEKLETDEFNYIKRIDEVVNPPLTSIEGVFVAGGSAGPKDIPDSILSAGNAAAEVASYINQQK
jgi:heterodisulfide reductase subunit A-like polyferredoxin